ncbi:MAG: helix-turn-helix transcriptional regulator [Bacilli bacterium]|jgi:transcriptional regulator with XRE-family HTH domain
MEPLRVTIAQNLTELRKSKNLTQGELAEKFNYSDKSISKWEHGEATPNIEILQQLCDFYGVTLDYLTHSGSKKEMKQFTKPKGQRANRNIITALSVSVVWMLAILVFIGLQFLYEINYWMAFLWAAPLSCIVMITFNAVWGTKPWRSVIVIALVWTLLSSFYLELGNDLPNGEGWRLWMIFILGVPLTIAAILWGQLKKDRTRE